MRAQMDIANTSVAVGKPGPPVRLVMSFGTAVNACGKKMVKLVGTGYESPRNI
jgi:hypothetical protein